MPRFTARTALTSISRPSEVVRVPSERLGDGISYREVVLTTFKEAWGNGGLDRLLVVLILLGSVSFLGVLLSVILL